MVHKQLLATLAKHGVEPIDALGRPFDPNQHEAMVQQPDAEHPEGTVVAELEQGLQDPRPRAPAQQGRRLDRADRTTSETRRRGPRDRSSPALRHRPGVLL